MKNEDLNASVPKVVSDHALHLVFDGLIRPISRLVLSDQEAVALMVTAYESLAHNLDQHLSQEDLAVIKALANPIHSREHPAEQTFKALYDALYYRMADLVAQELFLENEDRVNEVIDSIREQIVHWSRQFSVLLK